MTIPFAIFFLALTGAVLHKQKRVNAWGFVLLRRGKKIFQDKFRINSKCSDIQTEIFYIQKLLSKLRAGTSLQNCLENPNEKIPSAWREKNHPAALLIENAIQSGNSCSNSLLFYKKIQESHLKLERKKTSSSAQARMQAYSVCVVPWLLLFVIFIMDSDSFLLQWQSALCKFLWLFSLLLDAAGLIWIRKILKNTFSPKDTHSKELEGDLINFLLRFIPLLSSGIDINSAALKSIPTDSSTEGTLIKTIYGLENPTALSLIPEFLQLREILRNHISFGSPIREDLRSLLEDLQNRKENRWEECVQKLPLKLLPPLFLCIFLASLLVLFSLLIPYASSI